MKNSLLILTTFLLFTSCAKEQFATNKGNQVASGEALTTTSAVACAQSTLISPKVDILMLWDNTSSFNFVTSETKASMTSLISSVSENFDYHILSVPLVPANSSNLYESQLVAKNNTN
jgi:glycerol kinase